MSYPELSVEERATIQIGHAQGFSLRRIAYLITRSPSTISRELRQSRCQRWLLGRVAQQQMQARRQVCQPIRKLLPSSERFELVAHMLRERLSPEQIASKLRSMNIPNLREAYVCRETIYNAIYALLVGELLKELIICLRQARRRAGRARAAWIGAARSMVSIHARPPKIEGQLMPRHWEGYLIKGKVNGSSVGTLVERTSGYLMLVKMNDATATSAMEALVQRSTACRWRCARA